MSEKEERHFYFIYELPGTAFLANGYTFNGGKPIQFLNVDWFEGYNPTKQRNASTDELNEFLGRKRYIKPGKRYLVLGSPGHTFVMEPK